MGRSSIRRQIACVALPAIASLFFLLVVSAFVFGHAFRPGLYAEVLLVLYTSSLLFHFQRRKVRAAIFNTLLLLAFYSAYLTKFLVLREGMAASDLASIGVLFSFLPAWQRLALATAGSVLVVLLATNLARPRLVPTAVVLAPLLVYVVGCFLAPAAVLGVFEATRRTSLIVELEPWRDGPLITAARQLPRLRTMRQFLTQPSPAALDGMDAQRRARALASLPPPRRNLHMIVMEGFIDPGNFRSLPCPSDPVDGRFRRWMTESGSMALAATFGGITARAEFEILCGVPSYERLGVDFMALRGASLPCLPNLLRQRGYTTIASNSSTPTFFNRDVALPALGFERPHFAPDFVMTPAEMDGEILSDASFYAQTLPWVLPVLREGKPLLSYVLTLVGHHPFDLNPQTHPPFCPADTLAGKVANAAHYNSTAAADYVELLESRDPNALIVILADHLPSLGFGEAGYREADYRPRFRGSEAPPFWAADDPSWLESRATTLVVRQARQPVSLGIIPHYLIPEAVLDLLTDGAYCRATTCFHALPIISRPHGVRSVLTAPDAFPRPVCAAAGADEPHCDTGAHLNHQLEAEYDALLRVGVRAQGGVVE